MAGTAVPAVVIDEIVGFMKSKNFTGAELSQVAADSLRRHGRNLSVYQAVAERVRMRHAERGQIVRVVTGRQPVWGWVDQ